MCAHTQWQEGSTCAERQHAEPQRGLASGNPFWPKLFHDSRHESRMGKNIYIPFMVRDEEISFVPFQSIESLPQPVQTISDIDAVGDSKQTWCDTEAFAFGPERVETIWILHQGHWKEMCKNLLNMIDPPQRLVSFSNSFKKPSLNQEFVTEFQVNSFTVNILCWSQSVCFPLLQ